MRMTCRRWLSNCTVGHLSQLPHYRLQLSTYHSFLIVPLSASPTLPLHASLSLVPPALTRSLSSAMTKRAGVTPATVRISRKKALDQLTPFARLVYAYTKRIPKGRVSTYKLIASSIGHPKAFRAVGTALSVNPFAPHVPCHRVIASDGTLGGFNGHKGHLDCEVLRKAAMLRAEGVAVDVAAGGRVVAVGCVVSVPSVKGGVDVAELADGRLAAPLQ